jgi:hypothetical protein
VEEPSLVEGKWKLSPEAGAFGVGPAQGDISWFSSSADDVTTRACLFDDEYVFNADGTFQNILGDQTWLEDWQGQNGCGTPVTPHNGATATWSFDSLDNTITLNGKGAFLGLAKAVNGTELTNPNDAPDSITYIISANDENSMIIDIEVAGGAYWRFSLIRAQDPTCDDGIQNGDEEGIDCGGSSCNACEEILEPLTAAPTPILRQTDDVVSFYSDTYSSLGLENVGWDASSDFEEITVENNPIIQATISDFLGIKVTPEIDNSGAINIILPINATEMTHFHMDYWIADDFSEGQVLRSKLSNHSGGAGETNAHEYSIEFTSQTDVQNWKSFDIALPENFSRDNIAELIVSASGSIDVAYLDNIYLYRESKITQIPDTNFEQALLDQNIDSDGVLNGKIFTGDIKNVTELTIANLNISDLSGIQDFTNLENLDVSNNVLTTINLITNTSLRLLNLSYNQLTNLDIGENVVLTDLNVGNNSLTLLDVTQNDELVNLYANSNQLVNFDINQNDKLKRLHLDDNALEIVYLSNGANRTITDITLNNNPDLICITVDEVDYSTTNWTARDAAASYSLNCNSVWEVYVTDDTLEETLKTEIQGLDNDGDGKITIEEALLFTGDLDLNGKSIDNILGLEVFTNAASINISNNNITNIDALLNANSFLVRSTTSNKIRSVARKVNNVRKLDVSNNSIISIDISELTNFTELNVRNNKLKYLDVKNGSNQSLILLNATGNPELTCIQVDDVVAAESKPGWTKDALASYNTSCQTAALSVDNILEHNISVYPNPAQTFVQVSLTNGLELKSLEIYNIVGKRVYKTRESRVIIESLSKGIYFVRINTDKGFINTKLIKK